jgi:hypothetical protein
MDGRRTARGWISIFGADDIARVVWRKEAVNADGRSGDSGEISQMANRKEGEVCGVCKQRKGNVGEGVDTVGSRTICVCASSAPAGHIKPAARTFE